MKNELVKNYKKIVFDKNDVRKKFSKNISKTSLGDYIANKKKYDTEYAIVQVSDYIYHLKVYAETVNDFLKNKKEIFKIQLDETLKLLYNEKEVLEKKEDKNEDDVRALRDIIVDIDSLEYYKSRFEKINNG